MNIALILAGGTGVRMGGSIPKQFIEVYGKPVITYTLETVEKHPEIDVIAVVSVESWKDEVLSYREKYDISKLKHVIIGGKTAQESIRNGLFALEKIYNQNDFVMITDSVRPLVSDAIISDSLLKAREYGISMAAIPCPDAMFVTEDGKTTTEEYPRDKLRRTQRPHSFRLGKACEVHRKAMDVGIENATCTTAIAVKLGERIALSLGSENNLKLTTMEDINIFKALLKQEDNCFESF